MPDKSSDNATEASPIAVVFAPTPILSIALPDVPASLPSAVNGIKKQKNDSKINIVGAKHLPRKAFDIEYSFLTFTYYRDFLYPNPILMDY
jgi:hypothetical protein